MNMELHCLLHSHPCTTVRLITQPAPPSIPVLISRPRPPHHRRRLQTAMSMPVIKSSVHHGRDDNPIRRGKGMSWYHEMKLKVRDHELDRSGAVGNAVYGNYCQLGIKDLLSRIGFDAEILAISESSYKFIAPLRETDEFVLKVKLYDFSGTRLFFEDLVFKLPNEEPILKAMSTVVWLDKNYRPARIPAEMISKFKEFLEAGEMRIINVYGES